MAVIHGEPVERDRVLTVVSADAPDEIVEFTVEGSSRLFGRDEVACDIVIGSALDAPLLSRVAGRIWRMQGELWLRNLSTTHELYLTGPDGPPEAPLPPRRALPGDPGPARSIPAPSATITGPAGCELRVAQLSREQYRRPLSAIGEATLNLPSVPETLKPVAAALCEPLLRGGQLPASYGEVAQRAGIHSLKRARNLVGELCAMYTAELPALGERAHRDPVGPRRQPQPLRRRLRGGVWVFDPVESDRSRTAGAKPVATAEDAAFTASRRHSLILPDYYEVAHLLVRRRLITLKDVQSLGEEGQ